MEIAKENYFDVKYNSYRDVLEVNKKKKGKNKFIAGALGITLLCALANIYLIYKFFDILFTMGM